MSWGDTIDVPDTDEWHDAETLPWESERFDVATVTGYGVVEAVVGRTWAGGDRHVSAHVIDRCFNCRVVATYRSDRLKGGPHKTRRAKAVATAREHARILNTFDA